MMEKFSRSSSFDPAKPSNTKIASAAKITAHYGKSIDPATNLSGNHKRNKVRFRPEGKRSALAQWSQKCGGGELTPNAPSRRSLLCLALPYQRALFVTRRQ